MGRVKPEKRKPSKEDKDERRAALVEAINAKRQDCLDALDDPLPMASFRAIKALRELEAPSHPALPLAEASKLAATCALYLHLKNIGTRRPSGYSPQLILTFFRLAADAAITGLGHHKSGMCAWLWATVGFLVEDQHYRSIFDLNINEQVLKQLSDPREDEIYDAPMPPGCRSLSGEEAPKQRDGKDHIRALSRLEDRLRQSEPLGNNLSKEEQLQAVVERLITYQVVSELPLNAALLREVRTRMNIHLQMQALRKQYEQQNVISQVVLSKQMDSEIGKFRTLRDEQAKRALVILEQPMDEGEFQGKPVADFKPPASLFFERQLEDALTKQGRLPTPKERAANENTKTVMDYWSTTAEPMTHESMAKVLSVPVNAVRARLTRELKESQEKGGKVALQSDTQLKLLALEDWLSHGERGFAEMDCRGGTFTPSFLSAAPAILTQLESEDSSQQASLEHDYQRVIEGEGLVWEGDVPCSATLLSEVQLVQALQERRFAEPNGPDKPGTLHLIRTLFKGAASDGADTEAEELGRMAKLPAAELDTLEDAVERGELSPAMRETSGALECLAPGLETLRHGGLGLQSYVPPYDAHSMELLAEKAVERESRSFMTGEPLRFTRPMLADLRPAAMSESCRPSSSKTMPKMELILHGNEGMVTGEMMPLVSLCRGRLILALQYTLWRLEAWLHEPSWTVTPKTTPVPQIIKDSLNAFHEALCMRDDDLIQHCPLLQVNAALKDPVSGAPVGAPIDEMFASRYRFSAAENEPGTANGVKEMPYMLDMVELNGLMDSGSIGASESKEREECYAETEGRHAGAESDECTGYRANPTCPVSENRCCACQQCWHTRKWLGDGPSPVQYPEQEPFAQRDAAEKAELIEEIFDILETLKISKLLSTDMLRCVAGYIIMGLRATNFRPGANLLQLTWEHMAVLTAKHLEHLRDNLLRVLGDHWQLTSAYAEAHTLFSGPVMVAFNLSPDKSAFIAAHLPVRHEILQAEADITERHALASRNFCSNTSDEGREEELPAALPAPNPPKQARAKGRPEGHQHDSAAHGSGRPSPPVADLDAMIQDVAEEMIAVGNDAQSIFKFYVEVLYGAGNRAIAMPPRGIYTRKAQACEDFNRQMLRAAACGRLIFGAIDHRNRLSSALQAGVLALLARIKCPGLSDDIVDTWARCQSLRERDTSAAEEAIKPLFTAMLEILEDMQSSASRLWSLAIEEVERQVQVVGLHATAVEEWCLNLNTSEMPGARIAMIRNECASIEGAWTQHTDQVMSDLAEFRERAVQPVQIPTVESICSEERVMKRLDELRKSCEASQHQLYEAIQVGVLALTSLEHRISALRAALLSIIRRVELGSRLWHADVLQSSILAALSDRLVEVAKIQMEEQRQKAARALLESEEQSEKQKADAAAKKAAKKERAQKQKAEAAAQAAAAAEAEAAKLAEQRAQEQAEEPARAQEAAEAAGLEFAIMADAEGPSLHSHSLGGEACSDEEWEDVDVEVSGGGAEGRSLSRDRAKSKHSAERGHESTEQHENSAAGAHRKKKKSGGERKRAARAAIKAQAQEQKGGSAENAPPDGWPSQEQEDESEWQEAKPKRSQHRREHQEQMHGLNAHMENSMAHDRAPTASQRVDPVWASVNRAKPDTNRTQCMHCGGTTHKMSDCPELRNLGTLEKREVCIAIMDGFRERVNRILRSATARPYVGCQICDGPHQLQMCPHLNGMPPAQKADVFSAYRRNMILEKDALLRKWLEARNRSSRRATPAASPLKGKAAKPALATSTYPTPQQSPPHSADGGPRPQAHGQGPPQQGPRGSAGPAKHESIHSPRHQRTGQRGYSAAAPAAPDAGAQPQPHAGAGASWPREQSGQVHAGDWPPPPPGRSPRVQQHSGHSSASGQSSGWGQSGTAIPDSLNDDATSGMLPHGSPARPHPRERPHPAAEGSPPEGHMDPYAEFGEQWEAGSSEDEQTTYHPANCLQAAEPVMGVPAVALRPDQDFANLMSMLHPDPTDKPASSGPVGWSKVVADDAADLSAGPTPAEAKKSSAAAAQARQEDADMQAAIQASLNQSKPTPAQLPKYAHASAQQVLRGAVATPGLQNMIGEYNCFLNVVVQCLWHCRQFKRLFSRLAIEHPAIIRSNDVVAGLADLFSKFDDQERQAGEQQEMGERKIVAPTKLRDALHALNPERFSVGEMSDAAEVLGTIYEQMGALEGIGAHLTQVFELPVRLAVHCGACGKDTHQSAFVQSFYCVSATALRMQGMLALDDNEGAMPPLGVLLQGIDAQDQKSCDTDEGGCGTLNPVQCFLEGMPPPVFTLQLAWESHNESTEAISEVMDAVQEEVDIGHIYKALGSKEYRLHSMVCYYGEHYHAFVHTEGRWVAFDDATLNLVGAWENVIKKCIKGRIQPSLLFYEEQPGGERLGG